MFLLKRRYFFTKENKIRLRYVASAFALVLTTGSASYAHLDRGDKSDFVAPVIANVSDVVPAPVSTIQPSVSVVPVSQSANTVADSEPDFALALDDTPQENGADDNERPGFVTAFLDRFGSFFEKTAMVDGSIPRDPGDEVQVLARAVEESLKPETPDLHQVAIAVKKPEEPPVQHLKLASGDTLSGTLQEAGIGVRDAVLAIRAMSDHFDPRKVKAGQKISVKTRLNEEGDAIFDEMRLPLSVAKHVVVSRTEDGFESSVLEKNVYETSFAKSVTINGSLYASAAREGVPAQVIAELIRVYSWDVDFQRDIRAGDTLDVLYSVKETEDGEFAGYGEVPYASLSIRGDERPIYRFEMKDGDVDYFEPNGRSIRKTLMKTPIDGARLSSGFGMRKHPVLGYNKMHKGVDFAAPTGTPIYAAGDGVVEYAGRKGGYGNYIRIRHNGSLKTAYAHLHRFHKRTKTGKRVEQGEIIGYVGSTGRSTGPHLHYEVLKANVQVNPNRVDLPVGEALKGEEYARFKALIGVVGQEYASLRNGVTVADAASSSDDEGDASIQ